jgi:hypothetical protein
MPHWTHQAPPRYNFFEFFSSLLETAARATLRERRNRTSDVPVSITAYITTGGGLDAITVLTNLQKLNIFGIQITDLTFTTPLQNGWRRSELFGREQRDQAPMKVGQIDMASRTVRLNPGETKNAEGRVVKMTQEVYDLIGPCVEGKAPEDAVFTWRNGKVVKDFRAMWDHLVEASEGVRSSLLLHDFRRSAARNLLGAGVNQDVAMRITGHKTASMFSRYNIVAESDLAEAAEKLEIRRSAMKTNAQQQAPKPEIRRKLDASKYTAS